MEEIRDKPGESIIIGNIMVRFSDSPSENVKENIVDILSSAFEEKVMLEI